METGSLVTFPPHWARTCAAGTPQEREKEETALLPRNFLVNSSTFQSSGGCNYFLFYTDTGLPALVPSSAGAGCSAAPAVAGRGPQRFSPACPSPDFLPFPYGNLNFSSSCLGNIFSPPPPFSQRNPRAAVSTGTTIVAVTFRNGVVLGADTRTSAGSYVVNRAARKITPVHEKICVCRSGSAADTQAVTQIVKLYLQQYAQELPRRSTAAERRKHEQRVAAAAAKQRRQQEEEKRKSEEAGEQGQKKEEQQQQQKEKRRETAQEEEEGERRREAPAGVTKKPREEEKKKHGERRGEEKEEEEMSEEEKRFLWEDARAEPRVRAAATLFQSLCYEYKDILTAGLIVAGYDAVEGSQIYSIPLGGALMPMKCTAGGSGSSFISAFMDAYFHPEMDKETAVDFVKRCVAHAISRDGSSGGMVRTIVVTKHGLEEECVEGNRLPVKP